MAQEFSKFYPMKKLKQFESLVIHDLEESRFHLPTHSHTYYEMIYIFKGQGIHHINRNAIPYEPGDLFVLSPEDTHYFEMKRRSRMLFVKFTDNYFSARDHLVSDERPIGKAEWIMNNHMLKEEKLVFEETLARILLNTMENIVQYSQECSDIGKSPLMYYQILSVFGLITEAARRQNIRIGSGLPDKEELIAYIHHNIYDPEKTRIRVIATEFNIAPNYFGSYFRRNFDISYREYLNNYRTALLEKRLNNEQLTLKQIAQEFGFTDESHLNKFYKKQKLVKSQRRRASSV